MKLLFYILFSFAYITNYFLNAHLKDAFVPCNYFSLTQIISLNLESRVDSVNVEGGE